MKKLLLLILTVAFFSCEEFDDGIYNGPDQVGWGRAAFGSVNRYIEDVEVGDNDLDSLEIQLIGRQSSEPITINFELNDDRNEAIEGVHFNWVTTGGTVTIPANSSSAYVKFEAISDNFSIEESIDLVLDITSADVDVSSSLATVSHVMSITCSSSLAGDYTAVMQVTGHNTDICDDGGDYGDRVDWDGGTVTLTATATIGVYTVENIFGGLLPEYYGGCGYTAGLPDENEFTDVCGNISGEVFTLFTGDPGTELSGVVNPDGSISLEYGDPFGLVITAELTPVP